MSLLSKIQWGGFIFSLPSIIILNKGRMSLVSSIAKESYFPDDGRVLIGKKIEKGT